MKGEAVAYAPTELESRRQRRWGREQAYATPPTADGAADAYVFAAAPFTSGSIHMGHVRSYTIADAYARYLRMTGASVLFSIGFDSFGLPAELAAISNEVPTSAWVDRCCERMRAQLRRMGFSFDWEREFVSSDPQQYRWSQWLFLAFIEAGLVYRAPGPVDWCDGCDTVLASIQVEDGRCWRCGGPVRVLRRTQWYLRVSSYVAENEARLHELDEPDRAWLSSQLNVLGRIDGAELDARTADGRTLAVFTPYPEAAAGARFVAMSPRYPGLREWCSGVVDVDGLEALREGGWSRGDRNAREIPVIDTGCVLRVAGVASSLPLVITPAVDARYGETVALGIPEADRTDEILAQRISLEPADPESPHRSIAATSRTAVRYRARDFTISRQRSWGTPIPIVHCDDCGEVPVPSSDLPVELPREILPTGTGNPLASHPDFLHAPCPRCGRAARRETDTLDCHFDGIWMWLPICVPRAGRETAMFDHEELQRWLPGRRIFWGADGGGYIFDQRVVTKALRDLGKLPWLTAGEPFTHALMHEMVQLDGRKMSKHLGNVVDPDSLVAEAGADAVRLAVLLAAAPRSTVTWTETGLQRARAFLERLWDYAVPRLQTSTGDASIDESDPLRRRFARWCEAATRRVTEDLEGLELHRAAENVLQLFANIEKFESRARDRRGEPDDDDWQAIGAALRLLARLLLPFAPHIGEELWTIGGSQDLACRLPWPSPDVTRC